MRQTVLSVPLEVKPGSCIQLSSLIDSLESRESKDGFAGMTTRMPVLHFMSMSVFPASSYDPLFILEANFDGEPGPFWGQLEAMLGEDLRAFLRCCKRPLDGAGDLYDAVTAPNSCAPVAPYFEARTQRPSVYHQGNRGLTRDRILSQHALFLAVRDQLDRPPSDGPTFHGLAPVALHAALRGEMAPRFSWLNTPVPERFPAAEKVADWAKMLVYLLALLLVLSAPGLLLAALLPPTADLAIMALVALSLTGLIYLNRKPLPGTEVKTRFSAASFILRHYIPILIGAAIYVIGASLLLHPVVAVSSHLLHALRGDPPLGWTEAFPTTVHVVVMGLFSIVMLAVPALVYWLRFSELRDSSQDAPHTSERMFQAMTRREDWVEQNHMGSLVLIKPGILRTAIIKTGHRALFLVLRLQARDGYLGSMRTVHFAHWAFLNNGSRLLFFSNFDHSWGSYLDDFIEKSHVGLTLAWGCCVGFPPTRFLLYDGASHGREFKAWALASRAVSRLWYNAYPTLTVDQIERNCRIGDGLCKPCLTQEEASKWLLDL